jgi:hypothetical protein
MKEADMNIPAVRARHLQWLLGGVSAILFCGLAVAALSIPPLIPLRAVAPKAPVAAPAVAVPAARGVRCTECGIVQSTRKLEPENAMIDVTAGNAVATHQSARQVFETIIRMQDGSTRIITDVEPSRWKRGERVVIMAGNSL